MKKMTKALAVAMALLLLLSAVLVSCASGDDSETEASTTLGGTEEVTTAVETDEYGQVIYDTEIPDDLNYSNAQINILVRDAGGRREDYFIKEGEDSTIAQKVFERNEYVMERLGVILDFTALPTADMANAVLGASQDGGYDIVFHHQFQSTAPTIMGYYANLNQTKVDQSTGERVNSFKYLHLDNPYWNQNFIDAAQSGSGKLFIAAGDMTLSVYKCAFAMYFNKTQLEDITDYKADDIYDLVFDGKWTWEKLTQIAYNTADIGGDGVANIEDDFFGFESLKESHGYDGLVTAFNCNLTEVDSDGIHTIVTGSAYQKLSDAFDMVKAFYDSSDAYLRTQSSGETTNMFGDDRALFAMYSLGEADDFQQSMSDGFGIIPLPMFNEDQYDAESASLGYYTTSQDSFDVIGVVGYNPSKYEMFSAVLELLNSHSYSNIRPYYVETLLQARYVSDENSVESVELILNGTRWDFADIYQQQIGTIRNTYWRAAFINNEEFTTKLSAEAIQTLNQKLSEMDLYLKAEN